MNGLSVELLIVLQGLDGEEEEDSDDEGNWIICLKICLF